MAEKVIIRQKKNLETEILALDPETPEADEYNAVVHVHQLTPYGMLLVSLGGCTALVLNTYARNHGLKLEEVELRLEFQRVFDEDCENCTEIEKYQDSIEEEIRLTGELSDKERDRLLQVAHYCPIQRMLEEGLPVDSRLVVEGGES